jgi:hypothetical protein
MIIYCITYKLTGYGSIKVLEYREVSELIVGKKHVFDLALNGIAKPLKDKLDSKIRVRYVEETYTVKNNIFGRAIEKFKLKEFIEKI